jgi:membrane fusion protein, multidrug efflux system
MIQRRSPHAMRDLLLLLALPLALVAWVPGCASDAEGDDTTNTSGSGEDSEDKGDAKKDGKKKGKGDEEKEEQKETPVPVEVVSLARGDIESILRSTTNLEAEHDVQVFSQAARLVTDLLVEEGDRVKRNQVLLRLQDDEQRSALAKVKSQYDKEAREYERQERLFEQDLIAEEIFNNATYELDQLRISMVDAERELGYTEVRAPIAGTITNRLVNIGDQITVGQRLFDMVDFDSIVARIYVPEKELARLRTGQSARLATQADKDFPYSGSVDRISPVVDPQTGTVKVTVALDGDQGLRPGMYVEVVLVTDTHSEALLVPKRSLVYDKDQTFVYKLGEERRVSRVPVQARLSDKEFVEPEGGLMEGDQIVIAGQAGLKDGSLVRLPGDPDPADEEKESEEDEDADVGDDSDETAIAENNDQETEDSDEASQ